MENQKFVNASTALGSIFTALSVPVCVPGFEGDDRGLIFPNSGWKSSLRLHLYQINLVP